MDSEPFSMVQSIPSPYLGNKDLDYCLLPIHENALELLRYYYPGAKIKAFPSPFEFTLFTEIFVSAAELARGRGVTGEYTGGNGETRRRQDGAREFIIEPSSAPFTGTVRVHWTGSLKALAWDTYFFRVEGAASSRLLLDQREVSANGVELSQGLHVLDLQASFSSDRRVGVFWKRRTEAGWNAIPGHCLTPRTQVHGLAGTYYRTAQWQGAPYLKRVDSFMSLLGADFPLCAPFSVRWEGTLTAPTEGVYTLGTHNNVASWLYLDNKLLVAADAYQETPVRLTRGRHRLRIDYQKPAFADNMLNAYPTFILYWTPPLQAKQNVPFTALEPAW